MATLLISQLCEAAPPRTEADDGGEEDAQNRHQQGVEQADDEDAAVGVALGVVDQRLQDAEAGGTVPEVKTRGDATCGQVVLGILERYQPKATTEMTARIWKVQARNRVGQERSSRRRCFLGILWHGSSLAREKRPPPGGGGLSG